MPKRQRKSTSSSSNPLSDARKGASALQAATNGTDIVVDKTLHQSQSKTDDLWHRKSGAGYHLFVSYYGSQPCGVVAREADYEVGEDADDLVGSSTDGERRANARGMSRAAKKRQKKKAKTPGNLDGSGANSATNDGVANSSEMPANQEPHSSHPLIQALASQPKHSHLRSFVQTLATPLPLTFRLRTNESSSSNELEAILSKEYSNHISPVSYDPTKSIHQSTPFSNLSKSNLGSNPKLKQIIVHNSLNGTLARQEIGSMLPVLALHSLGAIANGSKVLDLCASPGSKTLQALEIVARYGGKRGRVIANDVHSGRLDSLKEAVVRSGLPEGLTSRVRFTNFDASVFPPPESGKLFDAIICDVPCSGDGTIRKDKHILPMWTPRTGNELHGLQLKILSKSLELIKVGGFICYSTCSLNPVEDEAVVAAALLDTAKSGSKFELVEWPDNLLPGFVRRPGITDWKVAFYDQNSVVHDGDDFGSLTFCGKPADAEEAIGNAATTLWPPRETDRLQLNRCVRLLPQDNDTGGFFLVVMKRIK